ncbi:MAG: universal stress protein [Syntrophomonadaceae bacterium]|nr:universal stress protein [Syntrophomonadaceae bacterium]
MFKKILVPVDGSDSSMVAAEVAANIAMKNEGVIKLLYVVRPYLIQYPKANAGTGSPESLAPVGAVELGKAVVEKIKKEISATDVRIETELAYGNPAQVTVSAAKTDEYDLIVMGSRGISGLTGSLIGSVSQSVSHMAPCPVLLTRLHKDVKEERKMVKAMPSEYTIYL